MADKKISQLTGASTPLAGTEVLPIVQSSATVKVSVANLTAGRSVAASTLALNTSTLSNGKLTIDTQAQVGIDVFRSDVSANYSAIRFRNTTNSGTYGSMGFDSTGLRFDGDAGTIYFSTSGVETFKVNSQNLIISTAAKGINFTANTGAAGMTSQLLNWYEEGTWTPNVTSASGTVTVVDATTSIYRRVGNIVHVYGRIGMTTNASVGTSDLTISGLPFAAAANYTRGFGNLVYSNYSANDYGTGGAHGLVYVESSSIYHIARTVDISSRASTFYWAYSATYAV